MKKLLNQIKLFQKVDVSEERILQIMKSEKTFLSLPSFLEKEGIKHKEQKTKYGTFYTLRK